MVQHHDDDDDDDDDDNDDGNDDDDFGDCSFDIPTDICELDCWYNVED